MATATHQPKSARELYRVAKQQGVWDPEQIPVAEDRHDWQALTGEQREQLVKICSLFYEGESSVADTLAWWLVAMPDPDRRVFLASQVFEEAKHAEFFGLYFREVLGDVDTASYLTDEYRSVLVDELRERGERIGRALLDAAEPGGHEQLDRALLLGVAHYMGVVEGMMAATGYDYFEEMLGARGIFPRLLEGVRLIRADEGRHITVGMEWLRERIGERPEYAALVRQLFMEESVKIPARTEFVFQPNGFGLDRTRMMAIGYQHLEQRSREIGL
ncbi:MAG TPA: ribonucleotide-diphosphate reductase subunit beta [Terriglobia bacterium]|nr:ribonucleotide-diphosphate reductase subunit beta [Terriglobia bacterium]